MLDAFAISQIQNKHKKKFAQKKTFTFRKKNFKCVLIDVKCLKNYNSYDIRHFDAL